MIKLKELLDSPHRDVVAIFESPLRLRKSFNPNNLESIGKNHSFTTAMKERGKIVGKFKEYDIYEFNANNDIMLTLVLEDYTSLYFKYKDINNIANEIEIWQHTTQLGLCREFIFNYVLNRYDGILSDDAHTELGQKYWDKLLKQAQNMGYKTFVVKNNEKIELKDTDDINKFYFDSPRGLNYKFLILK